MTRSRNNSRGFTLLELILAMAMILTLVVSLHATLGVAYKAKRSAERAIRPIRTAAIVSDVLTRDLESMVLPSAGSNDLTGATVFIAGPFYGTTNTVQFCTVGSDGLPGDVPLSEGIRQVAYLIRNDVTPPVLVRQIQRNLLAPTIEEPLEEVICRNAQAMAIKYYDGYEWYDDWDSTLLEGAVPTQVRIDFVFGIDEVLQNGQSPKTYSISRLIPLAIGKPTEITQ